MFDLFNKHKNKEDRDELKTFAFQVGGIFLFVVFIASIVVFGPREFNDALSRSNSNNSQNTETTTSNTQENVEYTREVSFDNRKENTSNTEVAPQSITKPVHVSIDSIGVDSVILHPDSQRVDVLDEALSEGAVYYPGSGTLEQGNVFLFGHSTGFAVVRNQAYKTFNDLDKLNKGDEISLKGEDGKTYVYAVDTVELVDADTAFVELNNTGRTLTISTCHSFGKKSERWVVDATLKEIRA